MATKPSSPRKPSKLYQIPVVPPLRAHDSAGPPGSQIRRGELYRIKHPSGDPKRSRVVVVVSRGAHLASRFSTAICAPVYTQRGGLASEVEVGPAEGLKHPSAILCDVLTSFPRTQLTNYVGTLGPIKLAALALALRIALDVE